MTRNGDAVPSMPTPAGYQKHPSTNVSHFFPKGSVTSICMREQRTNSGQVDADSGFYLCGHCKKKLDKLGADHAG